MEENNSINNQKQTITEHLTEFRNRLLKCIAILIITTLILSPFTNKLYSFIASPLLNAMPQGNSILAINIIDPVFVPIKLLLFISFIITFPHTIYQIWAFISPALYKKEKNIVAPLIISSFTLFILGMIFCYYVFFPLLFMIIVKAAPNGVNVTPAINNYFSFMINMFLAFGTVFEVPIILIILNKLNIISIEKLIKIRPYIIVIAFVIAAILTPPDIFSQLLLAIPLIILYEIGIIFCKVLAKI